MRITIPYSSPFLYDEEKEIAYISGVKNIKYDVKASKVIGMMGKEHTLVPELTQDGKYVAFGRINPHKIMIYDTEKSEHPVTTFKNQMEYNHAEEIRWFQDSFLLTSIASHLWCIPTDGSLAYCLYKDPYISEETSQMNRNIVSIDTCKDEILFCQKYLVKPDDPWPISIVTHLKLLNGGWQKKEIIMPHYIETVRFDRHGGLYVFTNPLFAASRQYLSIPDDYNTVHKEIVIENGHKYQLTNNGEYCSVQVFKDGWYAVLYDTKTWKEIYRTDIKDNVISQTFSIHNKWWLLSGKRDYMLRLDDL